MAGNKIGGVKAGQTNKERYGEDFYVKIGAKGGSISRGGGFAADPELARHAGAIGGTISKRGNEYGSIDEHHLELAKTELSDYQKMRKYIMANKWK